MNNTELEKLKKYAKDLIIESGSLNEKNFLNKVIHNKIKNIFENIIKENFPFYKNYDIQFFPYGDTIGIEICVIYYYMGKQESHIYNIILLDGYLESDIKYLESALTDIKKDMINYPENEIQQKFLREC